MIMELKFVTRTDLLNNFLLNSMNQRLDEFDEIKLDDINNIDLCSYQCSIGISK